LRTVPADEEEVAISAESDKSLTQMFKKPLRIGLLVEPTVRRIWGIRCRTSSWPTSHAI
jgi:hypothetical protein